MDKIIYAPDTYNYAGVERVLIDRRWHYGPNKEQLPAITRILSATEDPEKKQKLEEWRQRVGPEEADRITKESTDIGNAMHNNLEYWITGKDKPQEGAYLVSLLTKLMKMSLEKNMSEIWGCEVPVYCPGVYGGIIDCVGVWNGKPTVVDFKNSRKTKRKEWIEDYRLQAGAYGLAHNELFGTNIDQVVVLVACREDGKVQDFTFSGKEYHDCVDMWLRRVEKYYAEHK